MIPQYEIDDEVLFPQPESHEWESERSGILGKDGDGKPFKKKYRWCILRTSRQLAYHSWAQYDDGTMHTVRLPAPDTASQWASYSGCYVTVTSGDVRYAQAMSGVEMLIERAEAY